jgi:hypothetical protein
MGRWSDKWEEDDKRQIASMVRFAGIMGLLIGFFIAIFFLFIVPPIMNEILISIGVSEDLPNLDCDRLKDWYERDQVRFSDEDWRVYDWAKGKFCQ